jgi:threonine/homoserine/homoserine lactone efflux protein
MVNWLLWLMALPSMTTSRQGIQRWIMVLTILVIFTIIAVIAHLLLTANGSLEARYVP